MVDLATDPALPYLAGKLHTTPGQLTLTELAGGVSNIVVLAEAPGVRCVVKQALAKLRVAEDWFCTPERIYRECDAIRRLHEALPEATVPRVLFEDRENHLFAMSAAAEGAVPWKTQLLEGTIRAETASVIGKLLVDMILATEENGGWRQTFGDLSVFVELRLDPYYRTTASRHPDLKQSFDALLAECLERRVSLVHGDFSPKNILVSKGNILLIDYEVVHFGDPSFDAAFLTNHLLLKAFHRPEWARRYCELAMVFWTQLRMLPPARFGWLEPAAVRHLGALMLARIDGKSPVEYLVSPQVKAQVREVGRTILRSPPSTMDAVLKAHFP